ncbi:hypothetical protein CDD83_4477 [Cordyceps sp. RAO-2017]|nr:hypothetical protein CDD83_4477 [Cordyceps sp. RAO-2017]
MFDVFAMLLSSITSFLFPIFASYKALKTADPAQLTPWLMYWVVFNCCLLAESWVSFILAWVPFYGYIRLFFFLYLILPQTQGARTIYEERIHPFLEDNEGTIDNFIATTHDRLKAAGLNYFRQAIEYVKTSLLGLPPTEQRPPSPAPASHQGYTQSLLARFSVPTARWGGAGHTGNDFYGMLANAVSAATGSAAGGASTRSAADPSALIPPHLGSSADKMNFIAAQRERLNIMLTALDREAKQLQRGDADSGPPGAYARAHGCDDDGSSRRPSSLGSGLSKSRSETDFEKVEAESGAEEEEDGGNLRRRHPPANTGGSWMPWGWGAPPDAARSSSREE